MSTAAKIAGSAVISLLLAYALVKEGGSGHLRTVFQGVSRFGLSLYVAAAVAGIFFRAWRYRFILEATLGQGAPSFVRMIVVTSIRNALADFLPARLGELSFFFVLSRYGIAAAHAAAPFGVSFILDVVVLFCVIAAAVVPAELLLSGEAAAENLHLLQFGLVGFGALVFSTVLLFNLRRILRLCVTAAAFVEARAPRLARLTRVGTVFIAKLDADLGRVTGKHTWFVLFSLTLAIRILKYGGLYILLLAVLKPFGLGPREITPLAASAAFIIAEASAALPASGLMGFGTYEAAFALVFHVLDIGIPKIASVIFAVHVISQLTGYALGAAGTAAFLLSKPEGRA